MRQGQCGRFIMIARMNMEEAEHNQKDGQVNMVI